MIKKIEDNDVFEAIKLMKKYTDDNPAFGYDYNEAVWIKYFLSIVEKQDAHNIAIGDYNKGKLKGFLTASAFINYYNNQWVMDVKDCVVDIDNKNNAFIVYRLFDYMIKHIKKHGGKHWRADSIRTEEDAIKYSRFLQKRYNSVMNISVRGVIE